MDKLTDVQKQILIDGLNMMLNQVKQDKDLTSHEFKEKSSDIIYLMQCVITKL